MANSKRRCKLCRVYHPAENCVTVPAGTFCSMEHAIEWSRQPKQQQQGTKERIRERKERLTDNDRSHWIKTAQSVFNAFVRARDQGLPCISCGRHHQGQYHAGHYRTTAAAPELRFDERNVHKQCAPCNNHKSGNLTEYRINLVRKIGLKSVEWLEGPHEPKKYTVEQLKAIAAEYRQKLKNLKTE